MGLLSNGTPLDWEETKKYAEHVKTHGIKQFINLYRQLKDRKNDQLKWGDEIEYIMVHFDHKERRAQLALKASEILPVLQERELKAKNGGVNGSDSESPIRSLWRPEYAAFQIEGTPGLPYGSFLTRLNDVENNMRFRRLEAQALLAPNERIMCFTAFPRMGCPKFTFPQFDPTPGEGITESMFFPDEAIYKENPRFTTITKNCRMRLGRKPDINIPLYIDENTPRPFVEVFPTGESTEQIASAKQDHIFVDSMGLGNGCCCLQVTFQACNVDEARLLYDQLAPLCPLMLALSAGSPIHRGLQADIDVRWRVLSEGSDDRTAVERGLEPATDGSLRIPKSRYDSIDCYISPQGEQYNDRKLWYDENHLKELLDAGVDVPLAKHIAHLFARDPLVVIKERLEQDDEMETDHFENINSTNWQTMRFKPPPIGSEIGWRVEFRPMDLQITDFENAAFVTFMVLITRVILSFGLNLLVPISKMEANMETAQKRDAARQEKFFFRRDILSSSKNKLHGTSFLERIWSRYTKAENGECENYPRMTLNEIFNGKPDYFPGLIPLIEEYLKDVDLDVETSATIHTYLTFIRKKASGELLTTASWIRRFVHQHPGYKRDSIISEEITYDLMMRCDAIASEQVKEPLLRTQHICAPKGSMVKNKSSEHLDPAASPRLAGISGA